MITERAKLLARLTIATHDMHVSDQKLVVEYAERLRAGECHDKPANGGSKTETIVCLLTRKNGCTLREIKEATGWKALSIPRLAKTAGLKLRRFKEKGQSTRYHAS